MSNKPKDEPTFTGAIRDGWRDENLRDTLSQDYKDLKEFFLNDERKDRLKKMGAFRGFFYSTWWLIKILFLRLTPTRRILVLVGSILVFIRFESGNGNDTTNTVLVGGLILLFVLALELKDKLLAKNELEAGRKIQQALLPERTPEIPGWDVWLYTKPANEVSGDLIDYMRISEDKYGITLADVAGKGLHAALLMAKLQTIIHTLLPDFTSVAKFGKKLNEIFIRESLPNIFASLVYFEISPKTGVMKFINAGHFPPIGIVNGEMKELQKGAPALGIVHNSNYKEEKVTLKKGDFFVIYTDGLTESRNQYGEFFEKERLVKYIKSIQDQSASQIGDGLVSLAERFASNAKQFDDLSLIVIKKL